MIKLEETENEYLVAIPAAQRERAKRIQPRDWDNRRQRWVYPRQRRIYDALIAEFAEDAAAVEITRPESKPKTDLKEENESLKVQMAEIRQSLSLIAQINSDKDESQISDLQEALAQREQTIEQLQSELIESNRSLQLAEREQAEMISHLERVERQLAKSQSIQPFNEQLKQNAIDATGGDDKFRSLLEELNIDRSLPIDITRAMESEFRQLLNPTEHDLTIYDLIREASEGNELPDDAIGLAHLIRKQRNIIAHQDIHRNTYQARVILCMFAAALLWPEFPE